MRPASAQVRLRATADRYGRDVGPLRPEGLLVGLSPSQVAAVTCENEALCIVAGAGSGKTTVLTRRVAWRARTGSADPEHILVVTFTRKAAAELWSRLTRLGLGPGPWAGTFHGAAYRQLRRHWADTGVPAPTLLGDPSRLVRQATESVLGPGYGDLHRAVNTELSWARARMIVPEHYPEQAARWGRAPGLDSGAAAEIMVEYERTKRRRGVLDLDDLIVQCAEMIEQGGLSANALRWRIRHLFIDEFQDVNPAQWRLIQAWRGDRHDLCVVGDQRQTIYAWNGADPSLLGRLPELVPAMAVLHLDENHRSSSRIVAAAGAVLDDPVEDRPRPSAQSPEGVEPSIIGFEDERDEAAAVARWLRSSHRPGRPWNQMAVLARTNARLQPVADALRVAGIPFRMASRQRTSQVMAGAIRVLRAMDRRLPARSALLDAVDEAMACAPSRGPTDMMVANDVLIALEGLVDEHAMDEPGPTIGGFVAWLNANPGALEDDAGANDAVELATFHRAKGLEWEAVAVVGLEDGTVPLSYARTAAAKDEERRLLYVAMTRAGRELMCSWARSDGADKDGREASPLLTPVRVVVASTTSTPDPEGAVRRISDMRTRLLAAG